jgi:flavin-dependent dehydrogenase
MKDPDVLIIGAGPAGSIAASLVHQAGLTVRMVERERFPRFVIGESLLPRCMEVLQDAQLLDAVRACGFQQKFGAKFLNGTAVSDFNFSDQFTQGWTWTWQVTRADFDLALVSEVQRKGVTVDFQATVTGIEFFSDESSVTAVQHIDGRQEKIHARYIIDASGYGRVIPRLFGLDKPSSLDPRKAVFAHVEDRDRHRFDEPNRIIVVHYAPGVWVWIIPFATGTTSVGIVGNVQFFATIPGDTAAQFNALVHGHPYLRERFGNMPHVFSPRTLEAWSATTERFYDKGFVLTGNVTEFLDPIFSSGVMFATVSSQLAARTVIRKLKGETVDWENDYTKIIQQGVDTFRSYVMAWYDGTLEKIFFAADPDPVIKQQICSVLAGYVWDLNNPYVRDHAGALKRLAKLVDVQQRLNQPQNKQ